MNRRVSPVTDRSSDLQADFDPTCRCFPARVVQASALGCGFRSCLPLRDSPGVPPGSLIDNACSLSHREIRVCPRFSPRLVHEISIVGLAVAVIPDRLIRGLNEHRKVRQKPMTFSIAVTVASTSGGTAVHTYLPTFHSECTIDDLQKVPGSNV